MFSLNWDYLMIKHHLIKHEKCESQINTPFLGHLFWFALQYNPKIFEAIWSFSWKLPCIHIGLWKTLTMISATAGFRIVGPGYESVYYGINNTRPIYSERAHRALQNPQVSCQLGQHWTRYSHSKTPKFAKKCMDFPTSVQQSIHLLLNF